MVNENKAEAEAYKRQRKSIETFSKGTGGDDLKAMLNIVSNAMQHVRYDVTTHLRQGTENIKPTNRSMGDIFSQAGSRYDGTKYYIDGEQGYLPDDLKKLRENYLVPELHIDESAAAVAKLAEDKTHLDSAERGRIESLQHHLVSAHEFLANAVASHESNQGRYVGHEAAKQAHAALRVLSNQLLPQQEMLQHGLKGFNDEYAKRHGNELYNEFIAGLKGEAPEREPRKFSAGAVKLIAGGAAVLGAAGGYGANELKNYVLKAPEPKVQKADPAKDGAGKPWTDKAPETGAGWERK